MTSYYERTGRQPAQVTPHDDPHMEALRIAAAGALHDKGKNIFNPNWSYVRSREQSEEILDAIAVYVLARVREVL